MNRKLFLAVGFICLCAMTRSLAAAEEAEDQRLQEWTRVAVTILGTHIDRIEEGSNERVILDLPDSSKQRLQLHPDLVAALREICKDHCWDAYNRGKYEVEFRQADLQDKE